MGSWPCANEQRKAGTASPWSKCTSGGTDKCLPSVRHFRRTLVGIAHQQTTLCICPIVPATMREIQSVVCLNAFPSVPPEPHSRQPSLRDALLGVATGEVSQAGESARRLSGRYSLRYLLANPLPCHSLRLVPEYEMAEKGSTNDEAVSHEETGGTWNNKIKGTNARGGTKLL